VSSQRANRIASSGNAAPPIEPTSTPTGPGTMWTSLKPRDLSELASDDSESRSKIEALTGVGNEQEQ
jgi:hypothetical protein